MFSGTASLKEEIWFDFSNNSFIFSRSDYIIKTEVEVVRNWFGVVGLELFLIFQAFPESILRKNDVKVDPSVAPFTS